MTIHVARTIKGRSFDVSANVRVIAHGHSMFGVVCTSSGWRTYVPTRLMSCAISFPIKSIFRAADRGQHSGGASYIASNVMSTQLKDMTFEVAQGALIRLVLVDSFCALAGIVAKVLQHREHDPYSTENPYANAATGLIAVFMILWLVVAAISALLVIAGKHHLGILVYTWLIIGSAIFGWFVCGAMQIWSRW